VTTNNDILAAEPPSLDFDIAPMRAAVKSLVENREPLMKYTTSVRRIPMGEQPVIVDGRISSQWDVLAKKPDLRSRLYEAKSHADSLADSMSTLHMWATGTAKKIVGDINPPLEKVRKILDAVPTGGTVSPADVTIIQQEMMTVRVQVWMVSMAMTQITGGIRNFLTHLISDHDMFAAGPYELRRMKDEVGRQISDEAMPFVLNPITSGIGNAMLQVGAAFLNSIEALIQVLGNALTNHEAMGGAVSALATASSNAWTKYEAAANAVFASDAAKMSVTLRKLKLSTAIESWNQFATFFSESNL
jgi:hypothetical protein